MKMMLALIAFSLPANASGIDMLPMYDQVVKVSAPKKAAAKPKPKPKPKPRYGYRAPPKDTAPKLASEAVTRCLAPVRVVGSQDVREGAAEESAKKAWMELVRWQSGESFQDIANASDYQRRCSRSSIGEAMGQYFHRCEIVANPCRPGMTEGVK